MQDLTQNKEKLISSRILYKAPIKYSRFTQNSPKNLKCFSDITNIRHLRINHKKQLKSIISSHIFTKSLTPKPTIQPSSVKSQRNGDFVPLSKFNESRNQSVTPQLPNLDFPVPPKVIITYKSTRRLFNYKLKSVQKVFS